MNLNLLKRFILLSLLFWLVITSMPVLGQSLYVAKQLDSRNGVSNSSVTDLFQDKDDLLWAATWDGVNVYDGTNFRVFNYSGYKLPTSIGNNVVKQIVEDRNGEMWIVTIEGLSRYDKTTGKFRHYFYEPEHRKSIGGTEYSISADRFGHIVCLSKARGLFRYDKTTDRFKQLLIPAGQRLASIKFDQAGRLWGLGKDGILRLYDLEKSCLKIRCLYARSVPISNFFVVNDNINFVTADKELFLINTKLQLYSKGRLANDVKTMAYYKGHSIFAWTNGGHEVLDSNFKHSNFLNQQLSQLNNTKITAFLVGHNDILWCATDGSGILKIAPEEKIFSLVSAGLLKNKGALKQVRAFCEVGNDLWIGTKGNGITILKNYVPGNDVPNATQTLRYPKTLNNNSVYTILRGNDDLIYIGTDGEGLNLYDQVKHRFISWQEIENYSQSPAFAAVYAIIQDTDNSIWLGTSGHGLIHLKLVRQKNGKFRLVTFKQYTYNGTDKGPGNDIIYCLQKGHNGRIWLGCRYGGLSVFDPQSAQFHTFRAFSYEGSLSHNDVLSLYLDEKDRLWIGTSYGLNWITEKDATKSLVIFKKLTVANGLPNNTIHGINADDSRYLWISTNKGLARIDPLTHEVERFQEGDGLQGNEFSDGAVWKDKNGYLLFGGTFGFNVFKSTTINKPRKSSNLLLTGLQLGNQAFEESGLSILHPGQKNAPNYELKPGDNYFEVNLRAIDFLNSEKVDYVYQLSGYDRSWQYPTESSRIKYTNLPAGDYSLKIKWIDRVQEPSLSVTAFNLKVAPYFWKSITARILYITILSLSVYFWLRYRKKRTELRRRLEMEHLLRLKEDELHQQQLGFFTNIVHELRTPLTLINGSVERFFHKTNSPDNRSKEQQFLSIVHRQSSRLTYLVNQLLDFRKIEAGHLTCQLIYFDISALLSGIADLFVPFAEQKSIEYKIIISADITGWLDKDKLEKIIFNLLSNAFKHSMDGQQVVFQVKKNTHNDTLNLLVRNTGSRLTDEELKHVFDRFFVAEKTIGDQFSSGIGLAFTHQLVDLLSGEITIDNKDGVVTFVVQLPLVNPTSLNAATEMGVKFPSPSYLLRAITAGSEEELISIRENNKRSLVASLENSKRQVILIVDDEPVIRFLLKDLLEEFFIVYEAETGRQAIELLQVISVDLIISDVMMPDINGLEFCQKVKNTPETCHLPFILLSAKGEMDQKTEGYDAGADAYIPKPFDTQHLMVRVKRLLEYRARLHSMFNKGTTETQLTDKNLSGDDRQFLNKVVEIIEANIQDSLLDASFLESRLNLSRMQLYRRMKTLSNMPPVEFIKHLRLQKTVKLLETTTISVNEVFYQSGFNNQSHFFREFKKRYGCSPNEYRSQQHISLKS